MSRRETRSLIRLAEHASAARTLNLIAVFQRHAGKPDYEDFPLFKGVVLNRSIIVKHRLRFHEREVFDDARQTATKVLIPFETTDLKLGARSFFVGQAGYDDFFNQMEISGSDRHHDQAVLEILDSLPSLDPFLMRERLRASGLTAARCYFDLTDADTQAMFSFVKAELTPLIGISFSEVNAQLNDKTSILAEKILANAADAELDPLRRGLGMSKADFDEGVFCWKGFIYYKWTLSQLLDKVRPVANEILKISSSNHMDGDQRRYIDISRKNLSAAIFAACKTVGRTLKVYEDAYADLTRHGQPVAFREFLLNAPTLFYELGERLGAVHHIVSFWRYRFPTGAKPKIDVDELIDLFSDFESSLAFEVGDRC